LLDYPSESDEDDSNWLEVEEQVDPDHNSHQMDSDMELSFLESKASSGGGSVGGSWEVFS